MGLVRVQLTRLPSFKRGSPYKNLIGLPVTLVPSVGVGNGLGRSSDTWLSPSVGTPEDN